MKYFGIKKPKNDRQESHVFWFSKSEHGAWMYFFDRGSKGGYIPNGECMATAIKAYEAIGYKCIEVDVQEKTKD